MEENIFLLLFFSSFSSLTYGPYSLTSVFFRMIVHTDLSSALSLHISTPIAFRHCQYSLATLSLVFLLSSSIWFPQKYCFYGNFIRHFLPNGQPSLVFLFLCCYNIQFTAYNLQYIISSDSPAVLISYWAIYLSQYFPFLYFNGRFHCCVTGGGWEGGIVIFKLRARNSFLERN